MTPIHPRSDGDTVRFARSVICVMSTWVCNESDQLWHVGVNVAFFRLAFVRRPRRVMFTPTFLFIYAYAKMNQKGYFFAPPNAGHRRQGRMNQGGVPMMVHLYYWSKHM